MKKMLLIVWIVAAVVSCSAPDSNSPKAVVSAFIEASRQGDIDGIKKYITSRDVKLLEFGQRFMGMIDSTQQNEMKAKVSQELKDKVSGTSIEVGAEKINGDTAMVEVSVFKNNKKETHPFSLKKENGAWKISLLSTGMGASGLSDKERETKLKKIDEGMAGMEDSLANALKELQKINPDSLKKMVKEGMQKFEELNKNGEQKAP